jgi:hypothetical protein
MSSFSASTFFSASIIRASSPPEATLLIGRSSSPTLADIKNRTKSIPEASGSFSSKQMANRTFGISSCRSSS